MPLGLSMAWRYLSGVSLGRDIIASCGKPKLLGQQDVELVTLCRVPVENLKERRLCARCALGATELELLADMLDVVKVEHEILRPLRSSLSDGDQLGCL